MTEAKSISPLSRRDLLTGGALVIGLAVVSHWLLDALTHRPDLPLLPSSPTLVGLGLWNSVAATVVVESAMFIAGAAMWLGQLADGLGVLLISSELEEIVGLGDDRLERNRSAQELAALIPRVEAAVARLREMKP